MGYGQWPRYVSAAEKREKALKKAKSLEKKGRILNPIVIEGRTIAKTFWGKAWCANLESYSDYENRLPRGRTYVRNGSVIDLQISKGVIEALVMGSSLYTVTIKITPIPQNKWQDIVKACTGKIDSLVELLQGNLSQSVMELITKKDEGLFPQPKEISMGCSCPDWAGMCKHVSAVLYGIGSCLDQHSDYLFTLRDVDKSELIASAASGSSILETTSSFDEGDLSDLFGIELEEAPLKSVKKAVKKVAKKVVKKPLKKSVTSKKKSV